MSSNKSPFASHTGSGSDLSPFSSSSVKDIEQPISAKSMSSSTSTGQSVPSYSSIWRPELPAMSAMTSAAKYNVINNSGAYGFSRGTYVIKKERPGLAAKIYLHNNANSIDSSEAFKGQYHLDRTHTRNASTDPPLKY